MRVDSKNINLPLGCLQGGNRDFDDGVEKIVLPLPLLELGKFRLAC